MEMAFQSLISLSIFSFISFSSLILAQQPYVGPATSNCDNTDNSSSILGYTCNGQSSSCRSYLIFRSQSPYSSVSTISELLGSDPFQLSQINSVSNDANFETNKEVIVPVDCSCSGNFSQANASYVVKENDTLLIIANNKYQGLSTCQAIQNENNVVATSLTIGMDLKVPLRCACPTRNQSSDGVNYLLSYLVATGDSVWSISERFGLDQESVLNANGISGDPSIYPSTTLLVPLKNPPTANQTITPPPPLPPSSPSPTTPPSDDSSNKTWVYILIGILAALFVLIASFVIFYVYRRRTRRPNPLPITKDIEKGEKLSKSEVSDGLIIGMSDIDRFLKVYTFKELQLATDNFSPKHWIKGSVYRGLIKGDPAAIKKMEGDVSNEIDVLKRINHSNLIRLSGVCFDQGYWYLVYEYAENGPLSDWIFNGSGSKVLTWMERVQIALDVATGLNYLHSFTEPAHVHKDIKSSNILLDSQLRAKIANFAMARSAKGKEGTFHLTRHIVGTKGYMAPEYLENGLVSPKIDVYAFGVVMLEIITGREAVTTLREGDLLLKEALVALLPQENAKEKLAEFIDPNLQGNYPSDLALSMTRLTEACISKDPTGRPRMEEIVQSLTKILGISLTWELSNTENERFSYEEEI